MEKIINIKNEITKQDIENLKKIALKMKSGKITIFPTETVYGIGTNGLDSKAVEKIFSIKKRNHKNPINLLVSDRNMIEFITQNISPLEKKLMDTFFPGPFTIILEKKPIVPDIVTAGSSMVGIRMSSGKIAQKLVQYAGVPIAAPSANISGTPSGTNLKDIQEDFGKYVDYMIDDGPSKMGIESTVVRVIDNTIHILRPGMITQEQLEEITPNVILEDNSSLLPSNHQSHYSFLVDAFYVENELTDNLCIIEKVKKIAKSYSNPLIVCCTENLNSYSPYDTIDMGSSQNLEEISRNIYTLIRKINTLSPEIVVIEGVSKKGLGIAIQNRFLNACKMEQ